ncbi:MAG TPA: hypothetical protein VMG60_06840 [Burkholderiaceae bacterium]|nr:hypothetical protein [Burkholderiaceae bacterium]
MWSGLLHAIRPASLGAPIALCALLESVLIAAPGLAGEADVDLEIYGLALGAHSPITSDPGAVTGDERAKHPLATHSGMDLSSADAHFALIELPPDAQVAGSGGRPHHAFGYRWQGAESWLRDQGLDARTCYLPLMRLHSRISASGSSGAVWVYGRCTFR